jgi:hypothetical protein
MLAARGVAVPGDIRLRMGWVGPVVLIPVLAAVLVVALIPADRRLRPPTPGGPPGSSGESRPRQSRVWIGTATSVVARKVAVAGTVAGVVLLSVTWLVSIAWLAFVFVMVGLIVLITGLAMGACATAQVRIDASGVRARLGAIPWTFTTRIETITGAAAEQIRPMAWGGWGYRIGPRGSALVVRKGPGLVLKRRGRLPLAITIDDPEGAVALIHELLAERPHS